MAESRSYQELVSAVRIAKRIVDDAIVLPYGDSDMIAVGRHALRREAYRLILAECLRNKITDVPDDDDTGDGFGG